MYVKSQNGYESLSKNLFAVSKEYCSKGLSVLSTNSKKPTTSWKIFQQVKPDEEQLYRMFAKDTSVSIGVITGKVSGNLEVIDIDLKYDITGTLYKQLCSKFLQQQPELFKKLFKVKTKSGGYHWYYRCPCIQGNQKLASRFATDEEKDTHPKETIKVLIETRGEGGYVVAPPSAGYEFCEEQEYNIKEITPEERDELLWICRSFNEVKVEEEQLPTHIQKQKKNFNLTPWDDYNQRGQEDMIQRLEDQGWTIVNQQDDKVIFKRPGNTQSVSSGDFCYKLNLFTVFTTSSIFEAQKGYRPAGVFAKLVCGGDWRVAAKKLLELGYGEKQSKDETEIDEPSLSAFQVMQEHFFKETIYRNVITHFCEVDGCTLNEQALNSHYIKLVESNKKLKGLTKPNFDLFINSQNIETKNPIKEYLEALPTTVSINAISTLIESLQLKSHEPFNTYAKEQFKEPTKDFVATLFTKWLIGLVAGVYEGNYNPLMIVLIGPKNTGKTEFFRRLLPAPLKQYFAQSKFNDGNIYF